MKHIITAIAICNIANAGCEFGGWSVYTKSLYNDNPYLQYQTEQKCIKITDPQECNKLGCKFIEDEKYELLVYQDSGRCFFDRTTIESTGGNQGIVTSNCYSNIGRITDIKDYYRDENGKFTFRLTYYSYYNSDIELVWSQTSWITDSELVTHKGDLSQIPKQFETGKLHSANSYYFHGLALRSTVNANQTYIDGTPIGEVDNWWNAVVTYQNNNNQKVGWGIPAFNKAIAARNSLEILVPEKKCAMNVYFNTAYNDLHMCSYIELNTDRIDTLDSALNGRIDSVESTLNGRIDYLQGTNAAHAFNGDVISDNKRVFGDLFEFSKTELLLLAINMITIVFGLFICWKGGLFSKKNKRGYAKVSQYYESDAVENPINA